MLALFKTVVLLAISLVLALAALVIPAHLRSLDPAVLGSSGPAAASLSANAGPGGASGGLNNDLAATLEADLRSAHIGPVLRILEAARVPEGPAAPFREEVDALVEKRPQLRASGGPDRTVSDFFELIRADGSEQTALAPLLPQLLPRSERASLVGMLTESSNANVTALLGARDLTGLLRLHPASHAAGAPYDAGILTLALLVEGGHFTPRLAQQIGQTAAQASLGTPPATRALENFVIATLSLGRQLDHRSLADLAAQTETPDDWARMATLFRAQPDRVNSLYTALRFAGAVDPLFDYLATHPETARADLDAALRQGPTAVNRLLQSGLPLYRPSGIAGDLLAVLNPHRPAVFTDLSRENRTAALTLRASLLVLAGLAFALAMGAAWRASLREVEPVSWTNPSVAARNFFISLAVALTLWAFFEPDILKAHHDEPGAHRAQDRVCGGRHPSITQITR